MKGCQKYSHHTFFFSVISIFELHNLQDQIRTFFTSSSSSKQYSFLPFHFSKFDENSFYYLLFDTFPFFFFFFFFYFIICIIFQTTTLKQTDQMPSWNTMDKGFKKERLIKRLNRVTSNNVSRKKKKNTYMAQSRQK